MNAFIFVLLLSLFALAGCERENTRVINERRAAVSAKLDRIQSLRKALPAIPPVTGGKISMGTAPLVMAVLADSQLPSGTVVYEHALENLRKPDDIAPHYNQRIQHARLLEECGSLLERGGSSPTIDAVNMGASIARQILDACVNLEYVFVLRTRKLSGREFSGDILAFELASGKHLGGFPITFTSEGRIDTVTSTTRTATTKHVGSRSRTTINTQSVTSSSNADADQLRSDLAEEVESNIKRLAPGVRWLN